MANDVKVNISNRAESLSVISFDVRQDATPIAPGDSSGSVGSLSVTARGIVDGPIQQRTAGTVGQTLTLNDTTHIEGESPTGHGVISGKITSTRTTGAVVSLEADTLLARLNTDRDVPPFFGTKRSAPLLTARDNLSANPSFEVSAGTSGFNAGTGAGTGSRVANGGVDDGAYYSGVWSTAATSAGGYIFSDTIPATPTVTYTASTAAIYNKASLAPGASAQRVVIAMRFYSASNAVLATQSSDAFILNNGQWLRASIRGDAPAATSYLRVLIITTAGTGFVNPAVNDELGFDQILVEQSSTPGAYFDGNSPNATWTGVVGASVSALRVYGSVPSPNYDATVANAFRYFCSLVGIPETQIVIDSVFEGVPVAYPAWSGNVWVKVKEFCVAVGGEVVADADLIYLRDIRRYDIKPETLISSTISVDGEANAQFTQIYNYNTRWLTDSLAWVAPSTYTVDTNEVQYQSFTVEHSLTSVNSPIPVQQMPLDYEYSGGTGLYVVRDSDNKIVNPAWWTANGGRITTRLVEGSYNEITLIITGPTRGTVTYKAPYSVGNTGTEEPGIFISGSGVFINKQLVSIATGAGPDETSNINSSTIDNVFLSDIATVRDRGALAAGYDGGPVVTLSASAPINTPVSLRGGTAGVVSFGTLAGSRLKTADNIFRITSASPGLSSINLSGIADMTFDDLTELYSLSFDEANILYAGLTFDAFNALWPSTLTFSEFEALQPAPTFDDINAIFEGVTFNQHAVTPYIEKVIVPNHESII